jgi:hypothetical protein
MSRSAENCQFAEILIKRYQDPAVSVSAAQNLVVAWVRRPIANPFHVVPSCPQFVAGTTPGAAVHQNLVSGHHA